MNDACFFYIVDRIILFGRIHTVWIFAWRIYFFVVGGGLNYVLLQKDSKNICRTKVCDIPVKV